MVLDGYALELLQAISPGGREVEVKIRLPREPNTP